MWRFGTSTRRATPQAGCNQALLDECKKSVEKGLFIKKDKDATGTRNEGTKEPIDGRSLLSFCFFEPFPLRGTDGF